MWLWTILFIWSLEQCTLHEVCLGGGNQNQDWNRKIIPYLLEMAKKLYICTVLHLQFWIFKKKRKYKEIIAVISVEQDV